ncbi:hypothetical protein ABIE66_000899 [Peribacillus sp. B2I2]
MNVLLITKHDEELGKAFGQRAVEMTKRMIYV